ncbi:ubiquinol-cytochrome c reductase iron-sulfur subunit [Bacteroidota bacterium]
MKVDFIFNKKTKRIVLLLIFSLSVFSCREQEDYIPYVFVEEEIYLTNQSNSNLRVPGGYLIIPEKGVNGIILYRKSLGEYDDFVAFDLTCSYQPTENCVVEVDSNYGIFLECPCCGSKFYIYDGYVAEPPAKRQLSQYRTSFNNNIVRIFN